jgi:hypothetical protein
MGRLDARVVRIGMCVYGRARYYDRSQAGLSSVDRNRQVSPPNWQGRGTSAAHNATSPSSLDPFHRLINSTCVPFVGVPSQDPHQVLAAAGIDGHDQLYPPRVSARCVLNPASECVG